MVLETVLNRPQLPSSTADLHSNGGRLVLVEKLHDPDPLRSTIRLLIQQIRIIYVWLDSPSRLMNPDGEQTIRLRHKIVLCVH